MISPVKLPTLTRITAPGHIYSSSKSREQSATLGGDDGRLLRSATHPVGLLISSYVKDDYLHRCPDTMFTPGRKALL